MVFLTINSNNCLYYNKSCILLQYYIKCKFLYQHQFYNYGYKKLFMPRI